MIINCINVIYFYNCFNFSIIYSINQPKIKLKLYITLKFSKNNNKIKFTNQTDFDEFNVFRIYFKANMKEQTARENSYRIKCNIRV